MPNILVICTANICRSPVVEMLLRDRLERVAPGAWTVQSAGTWAEIVRPAARISIELMAEQGFDITEHRSRMVTREMLADADLILCMTATHAESLQAEFPEIADRLYLLSRMTGQRFNITDPYGRARQDYVAMVRDVTQLVDRGLATIMQTGHEQARRSQAAGRPIVN